MANHWKDAFSFPAGAVRRKDLAYVALSDDAIDSAGLPHTGLVMWDAGDWIDGGRTHWPTAGLVVAQHPLEQLVAVGPYGEVLCIGSGDRHEERIGSPEEGPRNRGPLRAVRRIGDHVYAAGMDRQAWRRDGANRWISLDRGVRPPGNHEPVCGFESIDGFSETEIYAVGWGGEIWRFDGSEWSQVDSPTNAVLTSLCCAGDGKAYVGGRRGLLVRGRADEWEIVEQDGLNEDIWDLAWYEGKLYLATMGALFLWENDELRPVDFGEDPPKSCYRLSAADGVLWSIGAKDIFALEEGMWNRIE